MQRDRPLRRALLWLALGVAAVGVVGWVLGPPLAGSAAERLDLGCQSHVSHDALPTGGGTKVVSVKDYCGDTDEQSWRIWLLRPASGQSTQALRDGVVVRLREAGWTPIRSVPPIAPGFVSLCNRQYVATAATYFDEVTAERAGTFYAVEPIRPGEVAVALDRDPTACVDEARSKH